MKFANLDKKPKKMIMVILADNIEFSKYPQQQMTMHKILSQTFDLKYMVYWGPPQNIQILGQQAQNPGYIDAYSTVNRYWIIKLNP